MIFKKVYLRALKVLNHRIVNPIIKWANNKNTPLQIYCFLFFIGNKYSKNSIKLNSNSPWITIKEYLSDKDLSWSFFNNFRDRSRIHYSKGLKQRGVEIGASYILQEINFKKDDIIIDCGANNGDLWLYFYFLKKPIKYFAIEPGKIEFDTLRRNLIYLNKSCINSKIYNLGLGDTNKKTIFYYSPNDADSSIIKPNFFSESYEIKVLTLDYFIDKYELTGKKIKLLKLEAEGFEPEIIFGGKNTIKNIDFISADLGPERGENNQSTLPQVTNFLIKNGFEIQSINQKRLVVLFKNKNDFKN